MSKDHEYVIEKHGIVPVDYSCTGVVENFMKLTDGLQQFLEMKHGSKLSDMSVITNYMSNVGLLQKYGHQIFGISGTLGQQQETATLQKIYEGITTCQIPSFKRRKLFEVEGVVVKGEDEWIDKICAVVTAQTNPTPYRKERAVLVICEIINRAKVLHKALRGKVPNRRLYINNNMDNTATLNQELEAGEVIIATNLAGRGTDLKICDSVNKAGDVKPLEETKDISLLSRMLSENSESYIKIAKGVRDALVAEELTNYLEREIPKIKKKAELFSYYLGILDELHKSQNNKPADSELSALNEFWGIWLLKDFTENDSVEELKRRLSAHLDKARKKVRVRESPSSNLHHYTVFGNELRKNGDLAASIEMYTKAIQEDRCWAAAAYYNRAFASLTHQDGRQDETCMDKALQDLQNALKSVDLYCEQIEFTRRYSTEQTAEYQHTDSVPRIHSHIEARYRVLRLFKGNIDEAIKKWSRPEAWVEI
ncbi:hypothetical protein Q5P01_002461 [Channa striata]|uniref:SecA family profile domain-containing protein n=1 Tax=Channa striata TaxID=64152 RepID=A0AA88P0Q0_CHASR|nr:hypothetical protein Q5P01_002461 [Channa striata]